MKIDVKRLADFWQLEITGDVLYVTQPPTDGYA